LPGTSARIAASSPGSRASHQCPWHLLIVGSLQNLWIIEATWVDPKTSATYYFKSERLDYDDAIHYTDGDSITMLIEPDNPNRYHMEIAR
jgi:hypothetical protein